MQKGQRKPQPLTAHASVIKYIREFYSNWSILSLSWWIFNCWSCHWLHFLGQYFQSLCHWLVASDQHWVNLVCLLHRLLSTNCRNNHCLVTSAVDQVCQKLLQCRSRFKSSFSVLTYYYYCSGISPLYDFCVKSCIFTMELRKAHAWTLVIQLE